MSAEFDPTAGQAASTDWEDYLARLEEWVQDTTRNAGSDDDGPQPPEDQSMPPQYADRAHRILQVMQGAQSELTAARDETGRQLTATRQVPTIPGGTNDQARFLDRSA